MRAPFIRHVVSTFGFSIVQQFVGLGRHVLIAAYFGLSRPFDGYLVVYSMASLIVFNLSSVFDTVAVSRLVQIRDGNGEDAFWRNSDRLLLQSLVGGLLFSAGLIAVLYLALPIIAAGFTGDERQAVLDLARYFIPWIVIIIPYYAVSAHLKALWQFHWVFGAEILVMLVSIAVLWRWHDSVASLPVAYGAGYGCAFLALLYRRGLLRPGQASPPVPLLGSMANQHLANQIGIAASLVDRYFQSYLVPGGISALGYVGQIVNNLSSLMTFREIYVVPLATELGRREKLERILTGVVLISVPCTGFLVTFSEPLIRILFQRGQFTAEDARLTGDLLRILALALVISSLLAPMERLFQILNRISYSQVRYLVSLLGTAAFQYLFVFRLGWDVRGIAWAGLANSALVALVVAALVRRCGIVIRWHRIFAYVLFAAVVSGIAAYAAAFAAASFTGLAELIIAGATYAAILAAGFLTIRRRLQAIAGVS